MAQAGRTTATTEARAARGVRPSRPGDVARPAGRDAEIAVLGDAVEAARGGDARVLGLTGELGIGKSRLLEEARRLAERHGLLVLAGTATAHERDLPFAAITDALDDHVASVHPRRIESLGGDRLLGLAPILPAVARHLDGAVGEPAGGARFHSHRAVRALLELLGRERPFALLIDDLHAADDASLESMLHLIRRPPRVPHLLLFAARPSPATSVLLDALRNAAHAVHIVVEALDEDASATVLGHVADEKLRRRLVREAGGNPLYLTQLSRVPAGALDRLPPTLVAAVQGEIALLSSAARRLAEGAAVAGDPFDPELAGAAAQVDAQTVLAGLDELVEADIVRPVAGRRFCFRHPILRRAIHGSTPGGWRLAAHERVARALQSRGAPATTMAHHVERFARPGDRDSVLLLADAARQSRTLSPGTAARWYAAALKILPAEDAALRAELLAASGSALASAGRLEDGRDAVADAIELLPASEIGTRIKLTSVCACMEHAMGCHDEANRRLRRALERLPSDAPPAARALLELKLAATDMFGQRAESLRSAAGRASAFVGPEDPATLIADQSLLSIGALWTGDARHANEALERASTLFDGLDNAVLVERPEIGYYMAVAESFGERFAGSVRTLGRTLARLRHRDDLVPVLATHRARALLEAGRLEEASADIDLAEDAARPGGVGPQLAAALAVRAWVAYERDELTESRRAAAESFAIASRLEESVVRRTTLSRLALLGVRADPEDAEKEIHALAGDRLTLADPSTRVELLHSLTTSAIAASDRAVALERARQADAVAAKHALPLGRVRAACARAEALLADGNPAAAVDLALLAASDAERQGARLLALGSRLVAGQALGHDGKRTEAIAELRRVVDEADAASLARLREAAKSELRRLGARRGTVRRTGTVAPVTPAAVGCLTDRELEIGQLVAAGHSNKQVAAALFLSEKTVEGHLSRAFSKLGVRSRVELATAMVRITEQRAHVAA